MLERGVIRYHKYVLRMAEKKLAIKQKEYLDSLMCCMSFTYRNLDRSDVLEKRSLLYFEEMTKAYIQVQDAKDTLYKVLKSGDIL